jgi:hypothetical protein
MIPGLSGALSGFAGRGIMTLGRAAGTSATNNVTVTKPSGVASGDLLIAVMATDAAATWSEGVSWTSRLSQVAEPSLKIATRIAGGSEGANYTFNSGVAVPTSVQIFAFRGAAWDAIGTIATLSNTGSLVLTTVTLTGNLLFGVIATSQYPFQGHSTPSGMTLVVQTQNTADPTPNYGNTLSTFSQTVAAGATGSRTSTITRLIGLIRAFCLGSNRHEVPARDRTRHCERQHRL